MANQPAETPTMRHPERSLTRRQLLRAAGYTIGLPALVSLQELPFVHAVRGAEVAGESNELASQPPKRFCCIFFPNGVSLPPEDHPDHLRWHWFPHQVGPDYAFTETLQPLSGHRHDLTILSGLSHPAMRAKIAHITADTFLTGADSSVVYTNSISLDQLIASRMGNETRFASLTLSSDGGVGAPGRTQTLSFSASGQPIPALSEPRAIFNRLFGVENRSLQEQRRAMGRSRSILDNVLAETELIARQLSAEDRHRFDQYTTSVREIEQRLQLADRWLDVQRPAVSAVDYDLDASPGGDAENYIRAILDLIFVALLTDSTRAITYQITSEDAKGIGDRFPNSIGLPGHHSLSHGIGDAKGYEQWGRYDQFLARQLAYFLDRLRSTRDPFQDGALLDHTIVLYGCSTSRTHQAVNYPLILAGGQSMGFRHGQHRHFDQSKHRLSDLYVTLLRQFGLPIDHFADSIGSLDQVLA